MKRCSGFFFGLLDCWSSEGLFSLEPREDRLFWGKTSFNRTCFSLFISRLSWRRRKGELMISTSTSDCQNAQWNCWKGESDTVVYTHTVPRVTGGTQIHQLERRLPPPHQDSRPFSFAILQHSPLLMLLWDLHEAGSPARGGHPVITWECQGRKQAEAEDPRDDSATIMPQQLRRDPSPSQVSGVSKIPIKVLWMVKIAEKGPFCMFWTCLASCKRWKRKQNS